MFPWLWYILATMQKARELCKKQLLPYLADMAAYLLLGVALAALLTFFITGSEAALWWAVALFIPVSFIGDYLNGMAKAIQRCREWQQWGILLLEVGVFSGLCAAFVMTVF